MKEKLSRLVYSTETGRTCPICEQPKDDLHLQRRSDSPRGRHCPGFPQHPGGRKGPAVTLITGIPKPATELKAPARC